MQKMSSWTGCSTSYAERKLSFVVTYSVGGIPTSVEECAHKHKRLESVSLQAFNGLFHRLGFLSGSVGEIFRYV